MMKIFRSTEIRIRPDLASKVVPGFPWLNHETWMQGHYERLDRQKEPIIMG